MLSSRYFPPGANAFYLFINSVHFTLLRDLAVFDQEVIEGLFEHYNLLFITIQL